MGYNYSTGMIVAATTQPPANQQYIPTSSITTFSTWHHIVMTWDNTA
jgi:hypothetical protein